MRHHDDSHDDKLNHMKLWDIVVIAGSLGLSLFVCICVGVTMGRFIAVHAGTSPWGLILFSLIGAVSGFWTLYKKALSYQQDEDRHGRHQGK